MLIVACFIEVHLFMYFLLLCIFILFLLCEVIMYGNIDIYICVIIILSLYIYIFFFIIIIFFTSSAYILIVWSDYVWKYSFHFI